MSDGPDTNDKPTLALGEPPGRLSRRDTPGRWVWTFIGLQLVTVAVLATMLVRSDLGSPHETDPQSGNRLRSTALALEDRSLSAQAATVWREYLRSNPTADDRPEVLYRVARLSMESEDYGDAAAALVEADELTDNEELKSKIGPKLIECLRRLGQYGEVGRELSRRVEVDGGDVQRGKVLATFAGESFTEADLDRMIERTVERLLSMQPDDAYGVTRERLLQHYSSGEARQQMLQEILQRELFSRRARELELDRQADFVRSREFLETELLANRFLANQLEQIQPTDVDIESYYAAHQANYHRPETAVVIPLPVEADQVEQLLDKISSAEDFRQLAEEADDPNQSTPIPITRGQQHPILGDTTALFELDVGGWTESPVQGPSASFLVLVDSKSPARTPPLDEVRFRVEADYRARKRQELTQGIFEDLTARYEVRIHAQPTSNVDESSPDDTDGASDVKAEVNP